MAEQKWRYEKLDENGKIKHTPRDDMDGKITGKIVYGLKAWFDENPSERIRLGWIKHLYTEYKDIEYNRQTQYYMTSIRVIDEYTVEDVYHIRDKTEEMMMNEELGGVVYESGGITFYGGDFDEF